MGTCTYRYNYNVLRTIYNNITVLYVLCPFNLWSCRCCRPDIETKVEPVDAKKNLGFYWMSTLYYFAYSKNHYVGCRASFSAGSIPQLLW